VTAGLAHAHRITVIAAVPPLTTGAAQFNTAMITAFRRRWPVDVISWRRMYPPVLYRGRQRDEESELGRVDEAAFILEWHDPRTWRRAIGRLAHDRPAAVVLPWLHPVLAPQYSGCSGRCHARPAGS
jgi:hypothetical protein